MHSNSLCLYFSVNDTVYWLDFIITLNELYLSDEDEVHEMEQNR